MADRRCTAKARSGKRCGNRPIRGAAVCRMHGGSAPQVKKAAERRLAIEEIRAELKALGTPTPVDPLEALLNQVYESATFVEILRREVISRRALAGPNHLGDGARHILVAMYDEERDRLARMAKLCIEAGVAERRVALAERQGELLAEALKRIFSDLKLTKGQRAKVPATVRRHLSAVADVETA